MNEKKEKQNILYQNINLIYPSEIKVLNENKEKNTLYIQKMKNKKQSFLNSTCYNLQNTQSNITLTNKYYSILNQKRPKNLLKNLSFLNDDYNTNNHNSKINLEIKNNINENINNNKTDEESGNYYKVKTLNQKINFQDFYINNNKKNIEKKIKNNTINTTKYNILTFIPKSLLIQFARLPNIYFLATAIIQSIPLISPLTSMTAIFPLIFVLSISMIRDLIEDLSRLKYDRLNNNEKIIVYRDGKFIKSISSSLQIGELIIVNENKQIPSDLILIDSNLNEGMAYVETSTLDGEKNLKPKIANNNLCGLFKNLLNSNEENPINNEKFNNIIFEGYCQCDPPNSNLHKLDGRVSISYNINNNSNKVKFPITERQMILKGSILKNTNWIIGFVLYTGMNNKIILNSKRPRTKISIIEKKMNKYLIGIFILLIILCAISSFVNDIQYHHFEKYYKRFILLKRSHKLESFISFFTYFLLLNTLIPISLIITMEIVKIIQGFFISWDVDLYSKIRKKFAKAKTVSIIEELGNVNYIFSDKTGTLTANKMKFKYCIIYGKCYEYVKDYNEDPNNIINEIYTNKNLNIKNKKHSIIKIPKNFFTQLIQFNNENIIKSKIKKISEIHNSQLLNQTNNFYNEEFKIINEFWTAISIAHECVCSNSKAFQYSGVSPDDVELVKTAHEQGYTFLLSSNEIREIRINNNIQTFNVLNVLNFSSERKRMSIIIKDKNDVIKLYSKGADCEIIKRMSNFSKNNKNTNYTLKCVDKLSCKGYRSLLIGYKIINNNEYEEWNNKLINSEMNLSKKKKLIEKLYDEIEQNLELIGATIVEDKLQDKVPETIKDLRMAGIKIWVLTGDKIDTAENISLSCNLITKNQKVFKIFNNEEDENNKNLNIISKFFEEYNQFEKINKKLNSNFIHSNTFNGKSIKNNFIINNNKNNNNLNINIMKNSINNNNISNNINNEGSAMSFFPSINASILLNNNVENTITNISKYTKSNEQNLPFSIIIESNILSLILSSELKKNLFLKIALKANTVICCRVSPLQKSKVVKEVKLFDKNAITLAIGDGGNDVSMIMEAHLGIGIYGEEGMRAIQASDFAIGEFKFLRRLLFFHGRINNNRISNLILYFFYKNFVFSIVQFVYGFCCMGSGQTIIDDWFITFYNLVFTALPLVVQAITDFDLLESDNKLIYKFMPFLYKESREIYPVFNLFKFVFSLTKGFVSAFVIFYVVCYCDLGSEINKRGDYGTLWYMSFKTYTCIIISVNMTLFLNMRYITFLFPLIMIVTSFLFYFIFIVIVNYMTMFNLFAVVFHSMKCPKIYFSITLVTSISFLIDYMISSLQLNYSSQLSILLLRKIMNKENNTLFLEQFIDNRNKYSNVFHLSNVQNKSISKISFFSSNQSDNLIEIDNIVENTLMKKAKSSQIKMQFSKEKNSDFENRLTNVITNDKKDDIFLFNNK